MDIGLIREGKIPRDNRVAFTPRQAIWIQDRYPGTRILVQPSLHRCIPDWEYEEAGLKVCENLDSCDILLGIKEVPIPELIPDHTYYIFSHTRKRQAANQVMIQTMVAQGITLIDYECLAHEDGHRMIGFGFFAGVVGAHNGLKAYGERMGTFRLPPVYKSRSFRELLECYFGLKLPAIKITITGSGRVATGVIEIMNLLGIKETEPDDFLARSFPYPVFTHLKGSRLYRRKLGGGYNREDFHRGPRSYECLFEPFGRQTDILINGIYWEPGIPRLFSLEELRDPGFRIRVIADITCDLRGSVPCNLGPTYIEDPVYGVDPQTLQRTLPGLPDSVDLMAVDNLPNELPRDASQYFGEQLIKYVVPEWFAESSPLLERATILGNGKLSPCFEYLADYVYP